MAYLFIHSFTKPFTIHMAQRLHNKDSLAGKRTEAGPLRYRGSGGGYKPARTRPRIYDTSFE